MVLNNTNFCGKIVIPEGENTPTDKELDEINNEPYLSSRRRAARKKAIEKGFTDEYHMEGWLYFNRIDSEQYSGYDVDILHMTSSGEGFEQ